MLLTTDGMLSNINKRTQNKKYKTKIRSFPGAMVRDVFDCIEKRKEL